VEFNQYQQAARKTDQPPVPGTDPIIVPMLGLLGEAGSVATAYKKRLRDGAAFQHAKHQLREELGDVLWYVAVLADRFGLNLDDIAVASLVKAADRWKATPGAPLLFDDSYQEAEQLPRRAVFTFTPGTLPGGRAVITLRCDGQQIGDPLTDASHIDDDYRLHDVFHIAYACVLGWSPVLRSLMRRKRKSNPHVDEAEDGGRAIAIEEGISALVFSYAARHDYLEGVTHLDHELLTTIGNMVSHLEVSARRAADWEQAILDGFTAWRQLHGAGGQGALKLDLLTRTLEVVAADRPAADIKALPGMGPAIQSL
jgi:NTP pyrophosphatase (non-canonical NTP hydrolase)